MSRANAAVRCGFTARENEINSDALTVDVAQLLEPDNKGFNPRARFRVIGPPIKIPTRGIRSAAVRAPHGND